MKQWEVLARHKWVAGATITESCKITDSSYRCFTATIRGWKNFKIFEGEIDFGIAEKVKEKVTEIRNRIDDNDESVFNEGTLITQ